MAIFVWGTSRDLLARLEVGQDSAELSARFEVGQDSAELLSNAEIQQSTFAELFSKAEVTHSVELLGKGKVQQPNTAELLSKTEIQQPDSSELLGECNITHSVELLCNAIIKTVGSAELYAQAEVGQDSRGLFAKFEAQDIQILYAKGIIRQAYFSALPARAEVGQGSAELFAKAVVGQGSIELLGKGIVRNAASSDLKGTVDITHSIDLLGRAVIGHPALPVWLKAIFSMGLTNAYRDLGSIIGLRKATFIESLGKAVVRHLDSEELLSKAEIQQPGSAEHLGKTIIKNVGSAELLCGFAAQSFGDLKARMIIGPAKDSGATYISFYDPSDWINEVMGIGQGFIAIPWVEADTVVKKSGYSSARLTSTSGPGQYKEIRFGWGGMNWGVEAAVAPEVAPTPINTGGRGPRRGSRAGSDERREVPQSSYKELKAQLYVEMAILPGGLWDYQQVWQHSPTVLELGVLQGQIEVDPATGAITARQRHDINDRTIVTMCGGYQAYSKGTFTFDAEASAFGGANPVYTPAFGLVENKYDWFAGGGGAHAAMLYYGGAGAWYFYTEDDGDTESTLITGIDFSAQHTYIIDWEDATEFPASGRVRLWIDGDLKATHTVAVPTTPLLFFLLMNTYIVANSADDVWTKLHSFSVTGDT